MVNQVQNVFTCRLNEGKKDELEMKLVFIMHAQSQCFGNPHAIERFVLINIAFIINP